VYRNTDGYVYRPVFLRALKMHNDRIDVLRSLAIILVFLHHAQICLFPGYHITQYLEDGTLALTGIRTSLLNFSPGAFGYTGVHLFLIISGFLIHLGTVRAETKGKPFEGGTFFSKRFWRIYPPYILTLLFFCFAVQGSRYLLDGPKSIDLLAHAFMLHNLSDSTFNSINPSFWSIALEVQLYLVYPLLLVLRRRLNLRTITLLMVCLSLVMEWIPRALDIHGMGLAYGMSLPRYWFMWCAGAWLAEQHLIGKRLFAQFAGPCSMLFFLGMGAARYFEWATPYGVYFAVLGWLAFFEWWMNLKIPENWPSSIPFKAFTAIGLCSYSIYLIHQPFLRPMLKFFGDYGPWPLAISVKLVVVFGIIFLISWSLYQWVELPAIAIGARKREKKRAARTHLGSSSDLPITRE
jgi:peptidoglycan/LPS O-acetylase OafA/YrhL